MKHSRKFAFPFLILCAAYTAVPAAADGDINWSITPYIWASNTKVDVKADGTPIGGATVSFSDLLDITDASFQIVVEGGRSKRWQLECLRRPDVYRNVGQVQYRPSTDQDGLRPWFLDAAMSYWPYGQAGGLSLFGGVRYTSLDDRYKFSLPATGAPLGSLNNDRSFTDLLLGTRYRFDFNESWTLTIRGDYAFGDSEGILQLQAFVRYAVGKDRQHGVLIGYRYKDAEFEDGSLEEDFEFKGPVAGSPVQSTSVVNNRYQV